MTLHTILFNLFASVAMISATLVIISKNPIHSVIFLILVFCNATGLLLLLKVELLAMMFIIIYVGAIAVLFLFVVMMLNIKVNPQGARAEIFLKKPTDLSSGSRQTGRNILRHLPVGGVISLIFLSELSLILNNGFSAPLRHNGEIKDWMSPLRGDDYSRNLWEEKPWTALIDSVTNIQSLGYLIYTYYFYYFIMASLILLVAMIGAIVLTMHKRKNASKRQLIFKQVARSFDNTVGYATTSGQLNKR